MISMQFKTAIVIPCYNEEGRLALDHFKEYAEKDPDTAFIFVDDGSTDRTRSVLKGLCEQLPEQMYLIALSSNSGKAEAIRQGFLYAFDCGDYQAIGYFDADLSTPLENIEHFKECLRHSDIDLIMGARVLMLGYDIKRSALRHYLGRLFATAASLVLNLKVYDTQCGAKLFKNNSILQRVFSHPFSVRWTFDVEILARLSVIHQYARLAPIDQCISEYPLKKWLHVPDSKVKVHDFFTSFFELFKIWLFINAPKRVAVYREIHQAYRSGLSRQI